MALIEKSEVFVKELLSRELPAKNKYHNLAHTQRVLDKVKELAQHENCSEKEVLLLQLSAWFHDVGFVIQDEDNEPVGANMAADFLAKENLEEEDIATVKRLIEVTAMDKEPRDLLEQIIKDADCSHVGAENYDSFAVRLKEELELKTGEEISELDWMKNNVQFFKKHKFYTNYAQEVWTPIKQMNQKELERKIEKKEKKKVKKEKESKKLGRGVETMFRVTLKNHIELSAIADTKANILLSVNAIIISVALANLLPKLDSLSNSFLVMPTMILMVFSVASIILSVLSTRPNISKVSVTREMIKNNQTNILFFGNFYKMSLDDFEWGIDYLIENEETLYNSLTKDLYFLGLVLERKYRLLRITYNVFMIGIVVSALSFIASYYLTATIV